jgi:hypothetical protein
MLWWNVVQFYGNQSPLKMKFGILALWKFYPLCQNAWHLLWCITQTLVAMWLNINNLCNDCNFYRSMVSLSVHIGLCLQQQFLTSEQCLHMIWSRVSNEKSRCRASMQGKHLFTLFMHCQCVLENTSNIKDPQFLSCLKDRLPFVRLNFFKQMPGLDTKWRSVSTFPIQNWWEFSFFSFNAM